MWSQSRSWLQWHNLELESGSLVGSTTVPVEWVGFPDNLESFAIRCWAEANKVQVETDDYLHNTRNITQTHSLKSDLINIKYEICICGLCVCLKVHAKASLLPICDSNFRPHQANQKPQSQCHFAASSALPAHTLHTPCTHPAHTLHTQHL